jgi:putative ABC transport system permease protein
MNNIITSIKISLKALRSNKSRTALTVLGITIGIASVIIVYSAGEGIRGLLVAQLESFGTNIIQSEIKVPTAKKGSAGDTQGAMAIASGVQVTTMTMKDVEDVKKLDNITAGYGAILSQEEIGYGNELKKVSIMGVSGDYLEIDSGEVELGSFFTSEDDEGLNQVVVLGSKMKDELFGDSDALGKYVSIRKEKFRVVGVMKSKGAVMGMDFDKYVYVPVRTLQKRIMGVDYVMYMIHGFKDQVVVADTAEQIKEILRINHDIANPDKDDFRVSTMDDMMKTLNTVMNALTWLLLAIVVISLLVGGIGILNIMYVIVSERTAEIGLRKAVGANYQAIMIQFLAEAVLITMIGAVAGIVIGIFLSFLISLGANAFGLDWNFVIPGKAFAVSLIFAFVCGITFGVYPAKRAASLDPIEAMRRE